MDDVIDHGKTAMPAESSARENNNSGARERTGDHLSNGHQHPVAITPEDSDEEFYQRLGCCYFGSRLSPKSPLLMSPRDPAAPWLGPFPHTDGISGPYALQQACCDALCSVMDGTAALRLGRRLAVELRDPATQLAGASADVHALGSELLALARMHGFHADNPR